MPKLINTDQQLSENNWVLIEKEQPLDEVLKSGDHLLVPAGLWLEYKDSLISSGKSIAVWLDSDENPEMIKQDLAHFSMIALNFPVFTDGRSFSNAAILRQQYQYQGELRAIGDVIRDQLFYMKRCGFNSFELADDANLEDAFAAFSDFNESYQSTVEQPAPLFRRR